MKVKVLMIFVLCLFASSALAADSPGRRTNKKSTTAAEETCEVRCANAQKTCLSKCHSKDSKVDCNSLCEQNAKRCVERCPK